MTPEELAARTGRALSARVESFRVLEGGYSNLSVLVVTSAARLVARHPTFTPSTWHPTLHGQATAMRLARDATSAGWTNDAYFSSAATVAERLLSAHTPTWGINTTDIEDAAQLLTETPPMRSLLVHGDAGVGNFIVADVRIAGIIDFDNAWYGPCHRSGLVVVAFTAHRAGI